MSTWSTAVLAEAMPSMKLAAPGSHDVLGMGQPERDEEQAGLVDVVVVLVDDRDLYLGVGIGAA